MASALIVGEALIDVVRPVHAHPVRTVGGSPLNVAVGLSRLGVDTTLLTDLGDDADGGTITAFLRAESVTILAPVQPSARTSTATAVLDSEGQPQYTFNVRWSPSLEQTPETDAVHIGSVAAFLPPGDDLVLSVAREARDRARLVTFDPNIRPALLPGRGQVELRFLELVEAAHVVKLSEEDAAHLFPAMAPGEVLEHLLSCGPRLVVMTRGAAGAELRTSTRRALRSAETVQVVDSIGAGDSYMAALIHGLLTLGGLDALEHLDDRRLAWLGDRCALASSITVGRRGADPPSLDDLRSHTERSLDPLDLPEETHVRP